MALPQAVQRQADESDRLLKEMQQSGESDDNSLDDQAADESMTDNQDAPSTPDWEHKFSVLQGKYNAELPRLNQDLHSLRDQNLKLQEQINELKATPVEKEDFSEVRDELGDNAYNAFIKQQEVNETQSRMIDDLRKEIGQVGQDNQQSSEQAFYSTLATLVPEWETLNTDPKFTAWLTEMDAYSGKTRQTLMNEAASVLDVQRVSLFFNQWKKISTKKKASVDKQLSPNTSKTTTPVDSKSTYTREEVKKFYDDVAKGKYRNNQDQMKKIDYDISMAQAEGRIAA